MADDILKDSRFSKYLKDPRYRQIPRHERKVRIDKRFQSMFQDDKFKVKYTVDKRGRPINETSTENLRRYYDLESGESSDDAEPDDKIQEETLETSGRFVRRPPSNSEDEESDQEVEDFVNDTLVRGKIEKKVRKKLHDLDIDYARGEGVLHSESSSDEESSTASEESEQEHAWGELDADAGTTDEATRRLAVCNMDWDNLKASDIMVLFNSFLSPGGVIHKVTIYPSEYGLQRMKEEEVRGPIELVNDSKKEQAKFSDEDANEEGSTYNMEKLRRYQLNRLRYYYAVVECDSAATADKLYAECDGMEYESSSTKLDLRFIPDDTTFDQEPKEVCTKLPDLTKYKPRLFTTTALQQAKVELTWDATNPNRTEVIKNALDGKIDDLEINEYLASSSDDEDEDQSKVEYSESEQEEDPISKYKNLLQEIKQKEESKKSKDMEMEITWGLGVKEKAEKLVKKAQADDENRTPFEIQMQKRKEKKQQKKLERKQKIEKLKAEENKSEQDDISEDDIPSDVDMNDPYFAEEFNKPEFKKKVKEIKEELTDEEEEKKKEELQLLLDDGDGRNHFSLKKIQEAENESKKSKRKKKLKEKMKESKQSDSDFNINVDDQRFSAIFNSHHFNIDPTDPNYKKTKNMEKLIQEKLKRRPAETDLIIPAKKTKEEAELSVLVKSIKRKTQEVMKKQNK